MGVSDAALDDYDARQERYRVERAAYREHAKVLQKVRGERKREQRHALRELQPPTQKEMASCLACGANAWHYVAQRNRMECNYCGSFQNGRYIHPGANVTEQEKKPKIPSREIALVGDARKDGFWITRHGLPDLMIPVLDEKGVRSVAFVELKFGNDKLSTIQDLVLGALAAAGIAVCVVVADNVPQAIGGIRSFLAERKLAALPECFHENYPVRLVCERRQLSANEINAKPIQKPPCLTEPYYSKFTPEQMRIFAPRHTKGRELVAVPISRHHLA